MEQLIDLHGELDDLLKGEGPLASSGEVDALDEDEEVV